MIVSEWLRPKEPLFNDACKRCHGAGELKWQHYGGEVRYVTCARCRGTGKEETGLNLWQRIARNLRVEKEP